MSDRWLPQAEMSELSSLPAVLRRRAERDPDDIAIRHVDGRSLTNAQYVDAAAARARSLLELGVRRGDNIATYLADKVECAISWPGVAWSGAIEVPINPQLTGASLVHGLHDSRARFVVTTGDRLSEINAVRDELTELEAVVLLDEKDPALGAQGLPVLAMPSVEIAPRGFEDLDDPELWDPSCIIYTSGTTGPPKGVIVTWGQSANTILSPFTYPIDSTGPRYSYMPHYHMSGKGALYLTMALDETMVLRDTFSLSNFWSDIREHGCTWVQLFPQLVTLLLREPEDPSDNDNPIEVMVSMPATPDIDEFKRRFGVKRVCTGYGMTEIGGALIERSVESRNWKVAGTVPPGPPGIEIRLVDEHDYDVPQGEVGELVIRHRDPWGLNLGYYNRPEATAETWRNGWFHTGDALRMDSEGYYYFVDRLKDYIRCKGENVSSFEVEKFVISDPGVAECAAIGVPADLGEDDVKIVVVSSEGFDPEPEELYARLTSVMPKYMIPRYIDYVKELPKTPATGRIRKGELKKGYTAIHSWDRQKHTGAEATVGETA
jgi:crotonobetaine/carnitine-CoA ligase